VAHYPRTGFDVTFHRLSGDRNSHCLLGDRMPGHNQSQVSKRIGVLASAIYNDMCISDYILLAPIDSVADEKKAFKLETENSTEACEGTKDAVFLETIQWFEESRPSVLP
jgi:hypothetical protein